MNSESKNRSPLLLDRDLSTLLVIDVQEKLLPLISGHHRLVWNIERLIKGANILGVPVQATEQYPKGLGHTVAPIRENLINAVPEKTLFSCRECDVLMEQSGSSGRNQFVIVGIETHVCVQQTALDFMANGFDLFVVANAVGSRYSNDYRIALERMAASGVTITTVESVLFEWCEVSGTDEFKQISQLVKESPPGDE